MLWLLLAMLTQPAIHKWLFTRWKPLQVRPLHVFLQHIFSFAIVLVFGTLWIISAGICLPRRSVSLLFRHVCLLSSMALRSASPPVSAAPGSGSSTTQVSTTTTPQSTLYFSVFSSVFDLLCFHVIISDYHNGTVQNQNVIFEMLISLKHQSVLNNQTFSTFTVNF